MTKDYYYILGLKEGASIEEIKAAYRKLSPKFHPDHNNGDKFFEERFKEINEAYEALIKDLSMIVCPRCFGKGFVDLNDIKRLEREGLWLPGKCLYCDGSGKVKKEMPDKIDPADIFFGINLSEEDKQEIINFLILNYQKSAAQKNEKKATPQMDNNSRRHISKKIKFSLAFIFLVVIGITVVLFSKILDRQNKNRPPLSSFEERPSLDFFHEVSNVDQDGNIFKTIEINGRTWMQENLSVNHFRNGDLITQANSFADWQLATKYRRPVWCYYNYNPSNGKKYGKLYNWYAVNDPRGLAPDGWEIPDVVDWDSLILYLGGPYQAYQKMKSYKIFNALDGGSLGTNTGTFYTGSQETWTSIAIIDSTSISASEENLAFFILINDKTNRVQRFYEDMGEGMYVRCIMSRN